VRALGGRGATNLQHQTAQPGEVGVRPPHSPQPPRVPPAEAQPWPAPTLLGPPGEPLLQPGGGQGAHRADLDEAAARDAQVVQQLL